MKTEADHDTPGSLLARVDALDPSGVDAARRARIVRSLIRMRAMMQETRNKSNELKNAIERFKDRKEKIANG